MVHSALTFYLDNDWFNEYDSIITRLSQIQGKSKNRIMLELLKKHIDENRRFFDDKMEKWFVSDTLEKTEEKIIERTNALCKECGAVSTDARGFVVHSPSCSYFKSPEQIQQLIEWGRQQQAKASESGRRSLI